MEGAEVPSRGLEDTRKAGMARDKHLGLARQEH